jgi:hypothetical protein
MFDFTLRRNYCYRRLNVDFLDFSRGEVIGDAAQLQSQVLEERVYKRVLNTPKNGKTREGAISDGTFALIDE